MKITLLEAIRKALDDALADDPRVLLLGQDIGDFGGAFKVTAGLMEKHGASRVQDTPISESAMVGAAIGTSFQNFKPVVEMQFIDFIACGWNMLVNFCRQASFPRWPSGQSRGQRAVRGGSQRECVPLPERGRPLHDRSRYQNRLSQ